MSPKKARGTSPGFSKEERAAMQERVKELQTAKRRKSGAAKGDPGEEVLARIAKMPEPDRSMGTRLHAIITAAAPMLVPRLWYGMPAYSKDDKVVCFFQDARKFKTRYATLGFSDE